MCILLSIVILLVTTQERQNDLSLNWLKETIQTVVVRVASFYLFELSKTGGCIFGFLKENCKMGLITQSS